MSKIDDEIEKLFEERYKEYPIVKKIYIKFYLRKIGERSLSYSVEKIDKKFKVGNNYKDKVINNGKIDILVLENTLMIEDKTKEFKDSKERDKAHKDTLDILTDFVRRCEDFIIVDDECYNCPIPWCKDCGRYIPKLKSLGNDLYEIERECNINEKKEI